eukprot:COSAG01_NODE_9068_length_2564_cov_44.459229_2_plen_271_part_00
MTRPRSSRRSIFCHHLLAPLQHGHREPAQSDVPTPPPLWDVDRRFLLACPPTEYWLGRQSSVGCDLFEKNTSDTCRRAMATPRQAGRPPVTVVASPRFTRLGCTSRGSTGNRGGGRGGVPARQPASQPASTPRPQGPTHTLQWPRWPGSRVQPSRRVQRPVEPSPAQPTPAGSCRRKRGASAGSQRRKYCWNHGLGSMTTFSFGGGGGLEEAAVAAESAASAAAAAGKPPSAPAPVAPEALMAAFLAPPPATAAAAPAAAPPPDCGGGLP